MIEILKSKKENDLNENFEVNLSSSINDIYQLNIDELNGKNVIINILEGVKVDIMYNLNSSNHIQFNLEKNAILNLSIASFASNLNNQLEVNLKEASEFYGAFADFSNGKNEFDFVCNLKLNNAKAYWHLASLTKGSDQKNFDISFYHFDKNTYAKMDNYGVCEDQSLLSFLGTSRIFKGAKSSATHQNAKIMVFDKKCNAKASPTLCIDENDVLASHAAVVGQINEDHIFYLTSRGIDEIEAKKLITLGYLMPILDHFKNEEIKQLIKYNIETRV